MPANTHHKHDHPHHHEQDHAHGHSHHHHDHRDHHKMMIEDFKRRFWISLIITIPILLLSPTIQGWLGIDWSFGAQNYVLFGLSSIIFVYGGFPFLKGMVDELGARSPGMMTLIAVAIIVAYAYSTGVVFGLEGKTFFWELSTLVVIMLAGHWVEMRSVLGASSALEKLEELMPLTAHRVSGGEMEDVGLDELREGDVLLVKPGEKVPADGKVIEGESTLNESMLTGESTPVSKASGDPVVGGAINGSGSLRIKVDHVGDATYLSKVISLVKDAQGKKSRTQRLADRAAFWLTILALSAGAATLIVWLALGSEFEFALERMVTVMVISCPHALGLAIPLVASISTSLSAQKGLLIRNRTAFENARKISTIVFDKTGTLTTGEFGVTTYKSLSDQLTDEEVLSIAAALESHSEHPIADGIMHKVQDLGLSVPDSAEFQSITGKGVEGIVNGHTTKLVSPGFLEDHDIDIPDVACARDGETVIYLIREGELVGCIALADQVRKESAQAIHTLRSNKIKTVMITGDNQTVARAVSNEVGIDEFFAEVLPEGKMQHITDLQEKGEFVAMTGDGVNDAPALAQADVGIAIGGGTDVAAETADIILVNSDPAAVAELILFGKATYRKMIQNLIWATAYNILAIPLAAGVLYQWNIMISPALGAVLMSLSTVIVAINAQLLRRELN